VIALLHSEHLELTFVPPDHDIEAEAALPDMVCGDELLGSDQRMKQRRMHGAKYGDVLGRAEEPNGPGDGLESRAVKIRFAPVALPAADRQHEVDSGLVSHAGKAQAVRPARRPPLRHFGGRTSRRAVCPKNSDLERVAVVHGNPIVHRCGSCQHGVSALSCAGLTRASIFLAIRLLVKRMDCRVKPGCDKPVQRRYGPSA
jgi:hypothetical protein